MSQDRELVADNLSGDPNSKVNSETAGKKGRKRNQKLLKLVKEQLEFYFSDANLNKDRYLWNLIQESEDGYVDFEIFKDFNKMKALTTDPSMLARSISESSLLQLSDDKRRVCRVTPVAEPVGIDERTIYVECLPSHGNHEWLRGVFGTYGPICYISVPCYQASKKIKGFAFVEFEHAESALRACEHFGAKTDEIKAYVEAISKEESISNKSPHSFHNITAVISDKNLRYNNEESKQVKSGNDAEVDRKSDQAISSDKETDNIAKVDHEKKKKKKKNRKQKKKDVDCEDLDLMSLRVMSKLEWKMWRKKYLTLQKAAMTEVKRSLSLLGSDDVVESETTGQNQDQYKFESGLILLLTLSEVNTDVKDYKVKLKIIADVAFVEISTDNKIYIRCHNQADADVFLQNKDKISSLVDLQRLEGAEEEEYWKKIHEDRAQIKNRVKITKKRGFDKLVTRSEKAAKHIRFDDESNSNTT